MAEIDDARSADYAALLRCASRRSPRELAQAIIRDGEGATKFITVRVEGGRERGGMPQGRRTRSRIRRW